MELKDAIQARRSHKACDPEHKRTTSEIEHLMSLAVLSPTAFNIQHWRFVLVTDSSVREEIKKVSWGQSQVTDASLLVVLTGDLMAWDKEPDRYWKNAPGSGEIISCQPYQSITRASHRFSEMKSCAHAEWQP